MELSELTAYAESKYSVIIENTDISGMAFLRDEKTHKNIALLMSQWDEKQGISIERCDMYCNSAAAYMRRYAFVTMPFRMRGNRWLGIIMNEVTEAQVVFRLLDEAVEAIRLSPFTIVLDHKTNLDSPSLEKEESPYAMQGIMQGIPEKIARMMDLYEYSRSVSYTGNDSRNFYVQGKFMEAYEDDFVSSSYQPSNLRYPTYHSLNISQLRSYFTWRTKLHHGQYEKTCDAFAYLYLYELINGIGSKSAEDSFEKMQNFDRKYIEEYGNERMSSFLHEWMLDFAILHQLDPETAGAYAPVNEKETDQFLVILKDPDQFDDEAVCNGLEALSGYPLGGSAAVQKEAKKARHFFAALWRILKESFHKNGRDIFTLCFGEEEQHPYRLFEYAVYYPQKMADFTYVLNPVHAYTYENGRWYTMRYDRSAFDGFRLIGLLHEADRCLRKAMHAGHALRKRPIEDWVDPYIESTFKAIEKEEQQAKMQSIRIDFSSLEHIRKDAAETRDSLIVDEEEEMYDEPAESEKTEDSKQQMDTVLKMLLRGQSPQKYMRQNHLIPSVVADSINEQYLDQIGDSAVVCDGDRIEIVEDYREDLQQLMKEDENG